MLVSWTVLPFLGTPETYEAESVAIRPNGDLFLVIERAGDNVKGVTWPADQWAHVRQGRYPFKDSDPPGIPNPRPNPYRTSPKP